MAAARVPAPKVVELPLPEGRPFRLGVLSDTHRYSRPAAIPPAALERLAGCDAYVHCGDFLDPALLAPLAGRAPVYAVLGNVDPADLAPAVPAALLLRLGAWRVGAIHEAGRSLAAWRRTAAAFPERLDVLLFGHSHRPVAEQDGAMVFLNPGSAVDPRGLPACSVAVVELGDGLRIQLRKLPGPAPVAG
jgi:putative phosphoesterase